MSEVVMEFVGYGAAVLAATGFAKYVLIPWRDSIGYPPGKRTDPTDYAKPKARKPKL